VKEAGGEISPQTADLLAQVVGNNLWTMKHEISKLVLFASGRPIEEDDVKRLVSDVQQISVFNMVDAIFEFRAGVAGRLLQQLLDRGAAPAYLLVMLSRQIRMIARIKELQNQRKSEAEIQNRLGLVSEFAFRKTLNQAKRYPWGRIREVYHKLLKTDLSIKTGKYDGELALNILIAELCQRAKEAEPA
jgi:DNA polymerase-3 subunit delta